MAKKKNTNSAEPTLENALLLNSFMLDMLRINSIDTLTRQMKDPQMEGWDDNNVSHFYYAVCSALPGNTLISREQLLEYDGNISRHTTHINERRTDKVRWKYFQYLYLLFTEIYLDLYFNNRDELAVRINRFRTDRFLRNLKNYTAPFAQPIEAARLNKLTCWCATGAGKTLMMHVNMLQVEHYAQQHGVRFNNRLLITPKEGLSRQHLEELKASSIDADIFQKTYHQMDSSSHKFEILEFTKLDDKDGDKKVDVEAFETDNLVFIDEGHRGTGGDVWKTNRDRLSETGFSFEYSATFGQAIAASSKDCDALLREYGSTTLFNYSYKYFYTDGYGKDFIAHNLPGDTDMDTPVEYLIGGLLGYYEQLRLYNDYSEALADMHIEKPLAIFVGHTVANYKTSSPNADQKAEMSDMKKIAHFISRFVGEPEAMAQSIDDLLEGRDGLIYSHDGSDHHVYEGCFLYLKSLCMDGKAIYQDMLRSIFGTNQSGGKLFLEELRGTDGEIGMKIGSTGRHFGVINVGDTKSVLTACSDFAKTDGVVDFKKESSLFSQINSGTSDVNILIGAKKFTEGWSSWRVSTMCLMNVGTSDGSEIIQLFGRGVRLKGYNFSLKRSTHLDSTEQPPYMPQHITVLETLNIFGIRANYVKVFEEKIKKEGVNGEGDKVTVMLDVRPNVADDKMRELKYLQLKKGKEFVKMVPRLELEVDKAFYDKKIVIDCYSIVSTYNSEEVSRSEVAVRKNKCCVDSEALRLIDWTRLYYDMLEHKRVRKYYNLVISRETIKMLAKDSLWYTLYMPEGKQTRNGSMGEWVKMWQNVLAALLKAYIDAFYKKHKTKHDSAYIEPVPLDKSMVMKDGEQVRLKICRSEYDMMQERLNSLLEEIENPTRDLVTLNGSLGAYLFQKHLYRPLMYLLNKKDNSHLFEVTPEALVESEHKFMRDIINLVKTNPEVLKDSELYLLRNKSMSGIKFFEDYGFYPDFILWIVKGKKQYLTFIDPHGLHNEVRQFDNPKIMLYESLCEKQKELKDKNLILNSYIVTTTKMGELLSWCKGETDTEKQKQMFHDHHVYFMEGDGGYMEAIVKDITGNKV